MKKLRILGIVVFVIAAASFGYFKYEQINSKDNQAPEITMDSDTIQVSCKAGEEELLKGIQGWRCDGKPYCGICQQFYGKSYTKYDNSSI